MLGRGPALRSLIASTRGRKVWSTRIQDTFVLRLPDGTRVDTIDAGAHWEALTLRGERFRLDARARAWTALDPLPSPPLIPDTDTVYVTRDGETWRRPIREEHVVFAWNWYPAGLPLERAIADVETGPRRKDLDRYFVEIANEQPPADEAAYVLGRRLALSGGDQVIFERPGGPPDRVFLLPASIDVAGADLKNELINSTTINIPAKTTGRARE